MDCLLGIDIGSTSIKAVVYDTDGNMISRASRPQVSIANDPTHPNWQVYLPENIWDGVADAIRDALSRLNSDAQIRAAAVTGLGADAVPLDEQGLPLYPFINWLCPRTAPQYEWWLQNIGLDKTLEISGWQPFVWSTVLRFLWLQENAPEVARRVHKWLVIEDFVNYKLTGKYSTDYTGASPTLLFDQRTLNWSEELLSLLNLDRSLLPTLQPSGSFIGEITSKAAAETGLAHGTRIYQGGHDYLVGALAAGAISPGIFLDITGTWELVITPTLDASGNFRLREYGLTLEAHAAPGIYCLWGGGTAANMLEWFKDQIGSGETMPGAEDQEHIWQRLMDQARTSTPGANGIFFLPHFNGAACPDPDPRSLGAFLGLNDTTQRGDLVRAVIEGLDYGFLNMLQAVERGVGQKADKIVAIGGAVRNEFWMQNKADVSGRPVEVPAIEEATALGAAMLAGTGLGLYRDLEAAAAQVRKPGKRFDPNPKLTPLYAEFFDIYRDIYGALRRVNARIYDRFRVG